MAPAKPVAEVAPEVMEAQSATFIAGAEIPGHGMLQSVSVVRHKDLKLAVSDLGLLVTCGNGRQVLVPMSFIKAIYL